MINNDRKISHANWLTLSFMSFAITTTLIQWPTNDSFFSFKEIKSHYLGYKRYENVLSFNSNNHNNRKVYKKMQKQIIFYDLCFMQYKIDNHMIDYLWLKWKLLIIIFWLFTLIRSFHQNWEMKTIYLHLK